MEVCLDVFPNIELGNRNLHCANSAGQLHVTPAYGSIYEERFAKGCVHNAVPPSYFIRTIFSATASVMN